MPEIIVGLSHLDRRLDALAHIGSGPAMGRMGLSAVREQKILVHRKTGFTARTISLEAVTSTGFVTRAAGAAVYLEHGTRPHEIVPRNKKVLRFATAGNARLSGSPKSGTPVVFAKRVHHPGTKAYPFMLPGLLTAVRAVGGLGELIVRAWNGAA